MFEKLVVGRYLTLPLFDNTKGQDTLGGPAHFVTSPGRNYQIQMSEGSGFFNKTRTSGILPGQTLNATKAHRNFRWLHWQPGKVTYLPLAGSDILTGPMSGCWIVIFNMAGVPYVAHIGTYDPGSPATLQVKAAWAAAFTAGVVQPIAAFQPNRHLAPATPGLFFTYYGVVTAGQTLHAQRLDRSGLRDTLNQISTMVQVNGAGVAPNDPGHPNFV